MTLYGFVRDHLKDPQASYTDRARWALLQVCPHVLFRDIFNALFLKLLDLKHHGLNPLSLLTHNVYEDAKGVLVERGCLPKIKDDTRLLVINDKAQFLGDQFNGSFQSMSKTIEEAEDRLVSWAYRHINGNLCYEISRLHDKHNTYKDQLVESIMLV
ncbi:hypothetical protein KI688_006460 [Linnemannia hyalina]|uniref:Uncharacterized protein n=1 Tax=Linnemannia hyalina TaxID=64524 RepID=A0A9P7XL54_9FUNG|nr:hypothetical protein KI688_006460 [Linnemannia hyalina]